MNEATQEEVQAVGRALKQQREQPKLSPWTEIGIEEKVERLREAIQSLHSWKQWSTSATLNLEENIARFINHSHDAAGQAVVPFRPRYDGADVAQKEQSAHDPLA